MVSCGHCYRFHVLPDGVCESCGWDNDGHGMVENTRPDYCLKSPTKKHTIARITTPINANRCIYCLNPIQQNG
jgi:hypothetical protein